MAYFLYIVYIVSANKKYNFIYIEDWKYGIFNIVSKSTLRLESIDNIFKINCLKPYEIDCQNFVFWSLNGNVYKSWKYYFWSLGSKNSFIYWGRISALYWSSWYVLFSFGLLELIVFGTFESPDFFFLSSFLLFSNF